MPVIAGVVLLLALGGFAAAAFTLSGSSLNSDSSALAAVKTEPLGGSVVSVQASGPDGKPIDVSVRDGRLYPTQTLAPGEAVSVDVVVKRPGWVGWLVGTETARAPDAHRPAPPASGTAG